MADRSLCCAHLLSFFSVINWGRSVDIADRHREFVQFSPQFYQFPFHSFEAAIRCTCVRTVTHSWWLSSLLLWRHLYPDDLCSETYPDMDTATPSFLLYLFPSFTFYIFVPLYLERFSYRQHIVGSDHLQLLPSVSRPHTCTVIQSDWTLPPRYLLSVSTVLGTRLQPEMSTPHLHKPLYEWVGNNSGYGTVVRASLFFCLLFN